tara:strand:+ start:259 stop:480 length:222 start_codon:yes stop_codon:yes gene_type:complete
MVVEVVEVIVLMLLHHPTLDLVAVVKNLMVLLHHIHPHKDLLAVVVVNLETILETVVVPVVLQGPEVLAAVLV